MLFVVFNLDADDMNERREALLPAHREYMAGLGDQILWGGPLLADDGIVKRGGMYVIKCETPNQAREIAANDPFVRGGIYHQTEVSAWRWQSGPEQLNKFK